MPSWPEDALTAIYEHLDPAGAVAWAARQNRPHLPVTIRQCLNFAHRQQDQALYAELDGYRRYHGLDQRMYLLADGEFAKLLKSRVEVGIWLAVSYDWEFPC